MFFSLFLSVFLSEFISQMVISPLSAHTFCGAYFSHVVSENETKTEGDAVITIYKAESFY